MAAKLAPLLSGLAVSACSVVGIRDGTEEPAYQVTAQVGAVQIRTYGPRIAAETTIPGDEIAARSQGFRRLAGYIFGANTTKAAIAMTAPVAQAATDRSASQTIAMTAPVSQDHGPQGWTIRFFMPARYTMDTLPKPGNPAVQLRQIEAKRFAVIRFSGLAGADSLKRRTDELGRFVRSRKLVAVSAPSYAFYNPPWTLPFMRHNEVMIEISR